MNMCFGSMTGSVGAPRQFDNYEITTVCVVKYDGSAGHTGIEAKRVGVIARLPSAVKSQEPTYLQPTPERVVGLGAIEQAEVVCSVYDEAMFFRKVETKLGPFVLTEPARHRDHPVAFEHIA